MPKTARPAKKRAANKPAIKKKTPPAPRRTRRAATRSATRKRVRATTRAPRPGGGDVARKLLDRLGKTGGCGAFVLVAECVDGRWELARRVEQLARTTRRSTATPRPAARLIRQADAAARAMSAAGHPQRLAILGLLLEGPATYRALQHLTKLKAGPLYHHVNQLRLAGLILPKQRDLYELTRGGRNLMLVVAALAPLTRDGRRRPV